MTEDDAANGRATRRPGVVRRLLRRISSAVFGLILSLAIALVIGFIWFLTRVPMTETNIRTNADGIVVLTGGASRITDAIELLAAGRGRRLLISGVHPSVRRSEIARHVPEHQRVFDCCVDFDRSALNTFGNATETRRWTRSNGFRSLIVVTSAYHMPRAMAELGHQLPEVRLIPFAVVTEKMRDERWWSDPATARLLISEYVKYIVAMVRMRIEPDAQAPTASQLSDMLPRPAQAAGAAR